MTARRRNVLFLCTGNSARSILAEALVNNLPVSRDRFRGYSAGSHPTGTVNPLALTVLEEHGYATAGLRSKSWDEFSGPGAPVFDLVFTVCDQAAQGSCPVWPGQPLRAHWGLPDPAAVTGTDQIRRQAMVDTFVILRQRIELFASVPLASLDSPAFKRRFDAIGQA